MSVDKPPILEIKNLCTYYYTDDGVVKAVDDINLKVYEDESLGIVGESGCGKSTMGLSIIGLIQPPGKIVSGEILFEGRNLLNLTQEEMRKMRGNHIAMIFQDPMSSLNPVFTIGSQIGEAIELHQKIKDKPEIRKRVVEILKKVRISDPEYRFTEYPHQFSGGMRQRVMIAMAISCNPKLLIADEPTTSLDVTIQAQIIDLMQQLKQEFDSSILLITHNVALVAEFCDNVAVMYAGKLVEHSSARNVFKRPKHPYTQMLLGSVPRVDATLEELIIIPGEVPSLISPPPGCIFHPRCPKVMDVCRTVIPKMEEYEKDHYVACHLYDKEIASKRGG
jgi:oligopeptide/dipeptide ABC transporter ATP-binding protein